MCCWPFLFRLDVRRVDDRRPAGDLALDERRERLLSALGFVRNVATQIEQPLARVIVIERLVERVRELVEDRFRRPLGSKQGEPARYSEVRQPRFLRGWHIREDRTAMLRSDRICLD